MPPLVLYFLAKVSLAAGVAGIAYADEDIPRYDPAAAQWVKVFDASAAGFPKVDAFDAVHK